ncbi:MAG: hypothetical protein PHN56_06420 [Candidatus Nanoarchaeia archaeon]|nr:hypothetical protein [Candidatus Nanoarchaeia archaeon]
MKSQVFTSSMIIISFLTMVVLFEYNYFYLSSKSKLPDYLVIDDMSDIANNHFKTLQEIIGNRIYFETNTGQSMINFESYLNSAYSPIAFLNRYKSLIANSTKGMKMTYNFSSLENDLILGRTQRNITGINMSITHNYTSDLIVFQNISAINSINLSLSFQGTLNNVTSCSQTQSGKKITITGPNNYKYELTTNNTCFINLTAINGTKNDFITVGFNVLSNNLTIGYAGIDQFSDVNMKITFNSSYENLFKTSSAYNNVRIELVKGSYNLSKSFE